MAEVFLQGSPATKQRPIAYAGRPSILLDNHDLGQEKSLASTNSAKRGKDVIERCWKKTQVDKSLCLSRLHNFFPSEKMIRIRWEADRVTSKDVKYEIIRR